MTAAKMCENVINYIDKTFDNFVPRSKFDIIKVEDIKPKYVEHKYVY